MLPGLSGPLSTQLQVCQALLSRGGDPASLLRPHPAIKPGNSGGELVLEPTPGLSHLEAYLGHHLLILGLHLLLQFPHFLQHEGHQI